MSKSPITCHVLDGALGKPGKGVNVTLEALSANSSQAQVLANGYVDSASALNSSDILIRTTDDNGRCSSLLDPSTQLICGGTYRIIFHTEPYFAQDNRPTFYPRVEVSEIKSLMGWTNDMPPLDLVQAP